MLQRKNTLLVVSSGSSSSSELKRKNRPGSAPFPRQQQQSARYSTARKSSYVASLSRHVLLFMPNVKQKFHSLFLSARTARIPIPDSAELSVLCTISYTGPTNIHHLSNHSLFLQCLPSHSRTSSKVSNTPQMASLTCCRKNERLQRARPVNTSNGS